MWIYLDNHYYFSDWGFLRNNNNDGSTYMGRQGLHTYTYTCTYTHMYTCMHALTYTHTYMHANVHNICTGSVIFVIISFIFYFYFLFIFPFFKRGLSSLCFCDLKSITVWWASVPCVWESGSTGTSGRVEFTSL